jgi:hypothetical protein
MQVRLTVVLLLPPSTNSQETMLRTRHTSTYQMSNNREITSKKYSNMSAWTCGAPRANMTRCCCERCSGNCASMAIAVRNGDAYAACEMCSSTDMVSWSYVWKTDLVGAEAVSSGNHPHPLRCRTQYTRQLSTVLCLVKVNMVTVIQSSWKYSRCVDIY